MQVPACFYHVLLLMMFVPRLNKFSWVESFALASIFCHNFDIMYILSSVYICCGGKSPCRFCFFGWPPNHLGLFKAEAILCLMRHAHPTPKCRKNDSCYFIKYHLSLLGFYTETWQVCKLSINLLTLAGLSTNISVDKPATVSRCMVKSQTC